MEKKNITKIEKITGNQIITKNEFLCICDFCNGVLFEITLFPRYSLRSTRETFLNETISALFCDYNENYYSLKHKINPDTLLSKIENLTGRQIADLIFLVNNFWENKNDRKRFTLDFVDINLKENIF